MSGWDVNDTVPMDYQYCTANLAAILQNTETHCMVDKDFLCSFPDKSETDGLLQLNHPNMLRIYAIHRERGILIHEVFQSTFESWLKRTPPILCYQIPNLHFVNGVKIAPLTIISVSEKVRAVIKSMVSFIGYLHTCGYSILGGFDFNNMVMSGDQLKFTRLRLVRRSHGSDTADYMNLHGAVQKIFNGFSVPPDMTHFINLLGSIPKIPWPKLWFLLYNHVALMGSTEKLNFIRNCHEKQRSMAAALSHHVDMAILSMGRNAHWTSLYFPCRSRSFGDSLLGPIQDTF